MRTITLEEHYATPTFMDGPGRQIKEQAEAVRAHPEVAAGLSRLIDSSAISARAESRTWTPPVSMSRFCR
jgi:hypothetical protein